MCRTATSPPNTAPGTTGSSVRPRPCAEKIEKIYDEVGGFGTLLVFGFDYKHKPEAWHNSLRLLKQEVLPRLKHLKPAVSKAA